MLITLYVGASELWLLGTIVSSGGWLIDWLIEIKITKQLQEVTYIETYILKQSYMYIARCTLTDRLTDSRTSQQHRLYVF